MTEQPAALWAIYFNFFFNYIFIQGVTCSHDNSVPAGSLTPRQPPRGEGVDAEPRGRAGAPGAACLARAWPRRGARRGQPRGRAGEHPLSLRDTRNSPSPGAPAGPALGKRRAGARLPGAERAAKRGFHGAGSASRSGSLLWTRARHGWARRLGDEQV